jgi:hypothetical protein
LEESRKNENSESSFLVEEPEKNFHYYPYYISNQSGLDIVVSASQLDDEISLISKKEMLKNSEKQTKQEKKRQQEHICFPWTFFRKNPFGALQTRQKKQSKIFSLFSKQNFSTKIFSF